jgi:putative transposase
MARSPRIVVPGLPLHVLQRSSKRTPCFLFESDCRRYLASLREAAPRYGCRIHAYALLPRRVHLLLTPEHERSAALLLQSVGSSYVKQVNLLYGRRGTVWAGRYRSALVEPERFLVSLSRYIEMEPVRAGLASSPGAWPWSSYAGNAAEADDDLLCPHALYQALGPTRALRCQAYRALFAVNGEDPDLPIIRSGVEKGTVVGDEAFRRRIEAAVHRSLVRLNHGGDRRSEAFRRSRLERMFQAGGPCPGRRTRAVLKTSGTAPNQKRSPSLSRGTKPCPTGASQD